MANSEVGSRESPNGLTTSATAWSLLRHYCPDFSCRFSLAFLPFAGIMGENSVKEAVYGFFLPHLPCCD